MQKAIIILLVILSNIGIRTNAQWQNIGPEGGMVYKVVSFNSILLCQTAGGIYRSTNNGSTWVISNANLPYKINGVVVHKSKFYVSTAYGLYNSPDGLVWTSVTATNYYRVIYSNGINLLGVPYGSSAGKLYYSPNDGASWGVCAGAYTISTTYAAVAAVGSNLFLGANEGVWYSINNGLSWVSTASGAGGIGIGAVSDIKTVSGGLLVAASNGIYKHSGGTNSTSFTLANTGIPVNFSARKLLVLNNKYVAAVVNSFSVSQFPKLYSSTDGFNWILDNTNNPVAPIFSMEYLGSTAFIGNSKGLYKSSDNGNTWINSSSGIKAQSVSSIKSGNNKIYAAIANKIDGNRPHSGGVFSSSDNGATWQDFSLNDTMSVEKIIVKNDTIIAVTYAGMTGNGNYFLYRSINAGISWQAVTGFSNTNTVSNIYYENNNLFITTAGINGAIIDRSPDMGGSWQQIISTGYLSNTNPLAINTSIASVLFGNSGLFISAGSGIYSGGGIYKSIDNGASWVAVNSDLPVNGLISNIKSAGSDLYAYGNYNYGSALYRSTNQGSSWSQIPSPNAENNLSDIYSLNGSLYITTQYSNYNADSGFVYQSTNGGDSWNDFSSGLPSVFMGNITNNNSSLFLATPGNSVWSKNSSSLPVTFISIAANRSPSGNQVNWKVASESQIQHYDIERSTDGRTFIPIGTHKAKGNSSSQLSYDWLDVNSPVQNLFYRIKSVAVSGDVKYTSIVKVSLLNNVKAFTISPNPVLGANISLQFKSQPQGVYSIKLFNSEGKIVCNNIITHAGGNGIQIINLTKALASGIYHLQISSPDNTTTTQKIIINK